MSRFREVQGLESILQRPLPGEYKFETSSVYYGQVLKMPVLLQFVVFITVLTCGLADGQYMRREKPTRDSKVEEIAQAHIAGVDAEQDVLHETKEFMPSSLMQAQATSEAESGSGAGSAAAAFKSLSMQITAVLTSMSKEEIAKMDSSIKEYGNRLIKKQKRELHKEVEMPSKQLAEMFPSYRAPFSMVQEAEMIDVSEQEGSGLANMKAMANMTSKATVNSSSNVSADADQPYVKTKEFKDWTARVLATGVKQHVKNLDEQAITSLITTRDQKAWLEKRMSMVEASKVKYQADFAIADALMKQLDAENLDSEGFAESKVTLRDRLLWLRRKTIEARHLEHRTESHQLDEAKKYRQKLKENRTFRLMERKRKRDAAAHSRNTTYQGGRPVVSGFWAKDRPEETRIDPTNRKVYKWQQFKTRMAAGEKTWKVEMDWKSLPLAPRVVRKVRIKEGNKIIKTVLMDQNYRPLTYIVDQFRNWHIGPESPNLDQIEAKRNPYLYHRMQKRKRFAPIRRLTLLYPNVHDELMRVKNISLNDPDPVEREMARSSIEAMMIQFKGLLEIHRKEGKASVGVDYGWKKAWWSGRPEISKVTIRGLKDRIERDTGMPWEAQKLFKEREELEDDLLLNEYCEDGPCRLAMQDRGGRARAIAKARRAKSNTSLAQLGPAHRIKRRLYHRSTKTNRTYQSSSLPLDSVTRLPPEERALVTNHEVVTPEHMITDAGYNRKDHPYASLEQQEQEHQDGVFYAVGSADADKMQYGFYDAFYTETGEDGRPHRRVKKMNNTPKVFIKGKSTLEDDEEIPDYWKLSTWVPRKQWEWNKYENWVKREKKRRNISRALKLSKIHNSSGRVLNSLIQTDRERIAKEEARKRYEKTHPPARKPSNTISNKTLAKTYRRTMYYKTSLGQWKVGYQEEAKPGESLKSSEKDFQKLTDMGIPVADLVSSIEVWKAKPTHDIHKWQNYWKAGRRDPGLSLVEERKERVEVGADGIDLRNFSQNFELLEKREVISNATKFAALVEERKKERLEKQALLEEARREADAGTYKGKEAELYELEREVQAEFDSIPKSNLTHEKHGALITKDSVDRQNSTRDTSSRPADHTMEDFDRIRKQRHTDEMKMRLRNKYGKHLKEAIAALTSTTTTSRLDPSFLVVNAMHRRKFKKHRKKHHHNETKWPMTQPPAPTPSPQDAWKTFLYSKVSESCEDKIELGSMEKDDTVFRCRHGWCIPVEAWCNGVVNCQDGGSDEENCKPEHIEAAELQAKKAYKDSLRGDSVSAIEDARIPTRQGQTSLVEVGEQAGGPDPWDLHANSPFSGRGLDQHKKADLADWKKKMKHALSEDQKWMDAEMKRWKEKKDGTSTATVGQSTATNQWSDPASTKPAVDTGVLPPKAKPTERVVSIPIPSSSASLQDAGEARAPHKTQSQEMHDFIKAIQKIHQEEQESELKRLRKEARRETRRKTAEKAKQAQEERRKNIEQRHKASSLLESGALLPPGVQPIAPPPKPARVTTTTAAPATTTSHITEATMGPAHARRGPPPAEPPRAATTVEAKVQPEAKSDAKAKAKPVARELAGASHIVHPKGGEPAGHDPRKGSKDDKHTKTRSDPYENPA